MTDFHQEGIITTLHGLHEIFDRDEYLAGLEQKLEGHSHHVIISLLLPSLYSEIRNPHVLDRIMNNIQQVGYLHSMVVDIARFYLNYMRSHGIPLDDAFVDMMLNTYHENALEFIKAYSDDAEVNGLIYDRHHEELTAIYFRGFLWTAWERSKGPHESALIPSWNRVCYSVPDIYPQILGAVEADNA